MKTIIESSLNLNGLNKEPLIILNQIIGVCVKSKTMEELRGFLSSIDTFGFEYGFGSSHCWVKQCGNDNRILLITI